MTTGPAIGPRVETIPRRRLVDRLQRRFEARLTVVVGGGGCGKTTLLAEALTAESDNIDVWHPCTPADSNDVRFGQHIALAAARRLGDGTVSDRYPVEQIAEHTLAAAPAHVCLVIDDSHHIGRSDFLGELLARLPANGHVLLAGRRRPDIELARLDAGGLLEVIEQEELLLTDDELVAFANLRGVDIEELGAGDRWPAFVELASSGTATTSRQYLEEQALAGLDAQRRNALAAFAFVDGGDDRVARAVTGWALADLIDGLPLVRFVGDESKLHDLWRALLIDQLDDASREAAVRAAVPVHVDRGLFDRALDLAAAVGADDVVEEILTTACLEAVDGGFVAAQLERWRSVLSADARARGIGQVLGGLLARERDLTSTETWGAFDEAARNYEAAGNHRMELLALSQLGYISHVRADDELRNGVMERIARLADDYEPARPFLAFGEAWAAMTEGRADLQLTAMERIRLAELPELWQHTRDHLAANALNSLGRHDESLARIPENIGGRAIAIPGALVTEGQALWFSGQPEVALARGAAGRTDRHGARDRYIGAGWDGMMQGFAGDLIGLRQSLAIAQETIGANPGIQLVAQTTGLALLEVLVAGDEERAGRELGELLEAVPLGAGPAEQVLRNINPVAYILVPASRQYWNEASLGPFAAAARDLAEAFVASRDGDDAPLRSVHWADPGIVASTFPVVLAIELALRGVRAGRSEGRSLATWLCEHWGEPARRWLRSWTEDDELGDVARDVLARTPTPPPADAHLSMLGQMELTIGGASTLDPDWRRERVRAVLAYLALNPVCTRDQLATALWPDVDAAKASRNLRTTLNYVHGLLEPQRDGGDATWYVRVDGQQIRLQGLDVDSWRFEALLDEADAAERAGRPSAALPLLVEAVGSWRGDLAADLDHPWLDLERIHLQSRFVRASCRAAELSLAMGQPTDAVDLLRRSLRTDPWHGASYEAMANAYEALGDTSAARATRDRAAEMIGH